MRAECEGSAGLEKTKGRLDNNNMNTGKSSVQNTNSDLTEMESSNNSREKYVVIEGELKPMKDINKTEYDNLVKVTNSRIDKTVKGECKTKCRIIRKHCNTSKGKNSVKIFLWCNQNQVHPININMIRYDIAVLTFKNAFEANSYLDKLDKLTNK